MRRDLLCDLVRLRHELSPGRHDGAALFERVVTRVSALDGVADGVRQRQLQEFRPEVGSLPPPIAKRAPHAVHHRMAAGNIRRHGLALMQALDDFVEGVLVQATQLAVARKQVRVAYDPGQCLQQLVNDAQDPLSDAGNVGFLV